MIVFYFFSFVLFFCKRPEAGTGLFGAPGPPRPPTPNIQVGSLDTTSHQFATPSKKVEVVVSPLFTATAVLLLSFSFPDHFVGEKQNAGLIQGAEPTPGRGVIARRDIAARRAVLLLPAERLRWLLPSLPVFHTGATGVCHCLSARGSQKGDHSLRPPWVSSLAMTADNDTSRKKR